MNGRHFERGGHGVYACQLCGRKTRVANGDTGGMGDWCEHCFEIMSLDNVINDDGLEGSPDAQAHVAKAEKLLAIVAERGGNIAKVKRQCSYLWPKRKA
jgi:hypothetical protein